MSPPRSRRCAFIFPEGAKNRSGWPFVLFAKCLLGALLFVSLPAAAAEIPAKRVEGEPAADPQAPAWLTQPAVAVPLYPQTSVSPATMPGGKGSVKVRAQRGGTILALHLEWADSKPTARRGIGTFADAAAVQWSAQAGAEPPYIGMGSRGVPVALWFWRADGTAELLAAEGFGTLIAQPGEVQARGVWKRGVWRVVFARAVALTPEPLPVAFALWNGESAERDGLKRLSSWQRLRLDGDVAKVNSRSTKPAGNAARGKRLMREKGCAACHHYPGNPARPTIGPDLRFAGGLHAPSYLADSLREPSKVIVPCKGCFAEQDGGRVSIMPPFAGNQAEHDDLVAYLLSLR